MRAAGILIMIAFDHRTVHRPDDFQALRRIGIVSNQVTHTHIVGAILFAGISKHGLEGFEVGVDVTEECDTHGV